VGGNGPPTGFGLVQSSVSLGKIDDEGASMYHDLARLLRKNMTDAERCLWSHIRRGQLGGYQFRRQAPIGSFIVDFVCFERKIVLELDGGQHKEQSEADALRTRWLNSQGFRVMRFWNSEVSDNLDGILEALGRALETADPIDGPETVLD
jgi:very-short-patch-repair endonuclease